MAGHVDVSLTQWPIHSEFHCLAVGQLAGLHPRRNRWLSGSIEGVTLGEVMFGDVWLPGDQHGSPVPGATRPMTPENPELA